MDIISIVLIAAITIGGSFIQRVSGFGFGIFVMIFFPYLLTTFGQATTLSGLLAGSTALIVMIRMFRSIQWKILIAPIITYAITSVIAIEYLAGESNDFLKRLLGVAMIILGLYFIFLSKRMHLRPTHTNGLIVGLFSGVLGGLFAMPGPPLVVYLIESIKDKKEYVASMQAASVMFNVYATIFRAEAGFLTTDVFIGWAVGLAGVAIGLLLGTKVFNMISGKALKTMVYIIMIISGIITFSL